ncbi:MAG TPA: ATP-binding protein [Herbaspirillum sp.]|jgi:two-component system sensor histidine kinase QseC|nr:ATP-binding protein [Herbaspirillum sp.]
MSALSTPNASASGASWSLRGILLAVILTLTLGLWGLSTLIVYLNADRESQELFDQSLEETANLLLSLADHQLQERMTINAAQLAQTNDNRHNPYLKFEIRDSTKRLMYKNSDAPTALFTGDRPDGFIWATVNEQRWRIYTTWDDGRHLQIQVVEPNTHRTEISSRFAYKIFWFALLIMPLMAASIWWTVDRVFRVLRRSADEVSQRTPNDLGDVSMAGIPSEVHPLLLAINRLFERVRRTLEHEQRFTADAAHELRTPLAAIKTNLQVIQRARSDAERAEFIDGLSTSVDRASRLVEQLMTLARLDPNEKYPDLKVLDIAEVIATQLPGLRAQAGLQQLHLDVRLELAPCLIHKDFFLILLSNLLNNAFRYTPRHGRVSLSCRREQHLVCLTVADSGPGIPPEMHERVFDRFFRLADANKPGSGLGLSIVKRIADTHDASIRLGPGLQGAGLAVEVRFPA